VIGLLVSPWSGSDRAVLSFAYWLAGTSIELRYNLVVEAVTFHAL
jgi:hypothetical protein